MPVIKLTTIINAPVNACFDAACNIDLHAYTMAHSRERAVDGKTSGLIESGQQVTWGAYHFGLKFRLTSKVTELVHGHHFVDQQVKGPFKLMRHYHQFDPLPNGTLMTDEFVFRSPFGWLGKLVDRLFLKRYMEALLNQRNRIIKQHLEAKKEFLYEHQ